MRNNLSIFVSGIKSLSNIVQYCLTVMGKQASPYGAGQRF